jgi:peptidoglycan/xylan/chitin deacetylase (PgdA/CDA1 family)
MTRGTRSQGGGSQPLLLIVLAAALVVVAPLAGNSVEMWPGNAKTITTLIPKQSPPKRQHHEVKAAHIYTPKTVAPPLIDCTRLNCIALTFDDGPNPITTPQIVSTLEQFHVPASFFMVGSRVAGNGPLLRRMQADGYEIGNHSWSHPNLTTLPDDQVRQQVQATQDAITATGVPAPKLFRPPYGAVDVRTESDINMPILMWNEDPRDWAAESPAQVIQAVEASAKPGGIVDMHDIYHVTANALPQIISDLQTRGFHFVTVSELLQLTPDSRGLYYGQPAPVRP